MAKNDTEITCGNCGETLIVSGAGGSYPNGECKLICTECGESICPKCGDNSFSVKEDGDLGDYCGDSCCCGWQHCGGCI